MQRINALTVLALLVLSTVTNAQTSRVWSSSLIEGKCANGDSYKLQSFRQGQNGQQVNGYAYEGPLGKGSLLSSLPLEHAKRHVCKDPGVGRWLPDDGDDQ